MERAGPGGCQLMLLRGMPAAKQRNGATSTQKSRCGHCAKAATWRPGPETQGALPFFKASASFQEQDRAFKKLFADLILISEQGHTFHYVKGEGHEEGAHASSLWPRDGDTEASELGRSCGKPGFPQRERKYGQRKRPWGPQGGRGVAAEKIPLLKGKEGGWRGI